MPIFRSPVMLVLAIVACVSGAPSRGFSNTFQDMNDMGSLGAVIGPFEPPSKLAREEAIRKVKRNLDHIGGGNLLRNLDRIGGGNLLRDLGYSEKLDADKSRDKSVKSKVMTENSEPATGSRYAVVDDRDLGTWYENHPIMTENSEPATGSRYAVVDDRDLGTWIEDHPIMTENFEPATGSRYAVVDDRDLGAWLEDHPGGDLIADSKLRKKRNNRRWARLVNEPDHSGYASRYNFPGRTQTKQRVELLRDEPLNRGDNVESSEQMRNPDFDASVNSMSA